MQIITYCAIINFCVNQAHHLMQVLCIAHDIVYYVHTVCKYCTGIVSTYSDVSAVSSRPYIVVSCRPIIPYIATYSSVPYRFIVPYCVDLLFLPIEPYCVGSLYRIVSSVPVILVGCRPLVLYGVSIECRIVVITIYMPYAIVPYCICL